MHQGVDSLISRINDINDPFVDLHAKVFSSIFVSKCRLIYHVALFSSGEGNRPNKGGTRLCGRIDQFLAGFVDQTMIV